MDYIVGVVLLLLPNILGFSDLGGAPVTIPRVLGVVLIVYSIFTNYEWGVFKIINMYYHLTIDFLASAFMIASPWIFGFSDEETKVWLPFVVIGAAVILVVAVTQTYPGYEKKHKKVAVEAEA
jgi:predicted membrane protein